MTSKAANLLVLLFHFCLGQLLQTNSRTLNSQAHRNSFRDANIAANEPLLVCDHLDINVRELIRLANHHPRVNLPARLRRWWPLHRWIPGSSLPPPLHTLIQSARRVNDGKVAG